MACWICEGTKKILMKVLGHLGTRRSAAAAAELGIVNV